MSAPLLRFDDLSGGYGTTVVVRSISGMVEAGKALCVLGRNGVGKTTLMRLLSGHLPSRSGSIAFAGADVGADPPHRRRQRGMIYCPQDRPVFDNLTVKDNLTLSFGDATLERYRPFFSAFPILERRLRQLAGTLSGGERKILSFVRGLSEDGPLLLLDEPSEGVQHENIDRMADFISQAKAAGRGLLIVEQNLAFALQVADTILVIDHGESVLEGSAEDITQKEILTHMHV